MNFAELDAVTQAAIRKKQAQRKQLRRAKKQLAKGKANEKKLKQLEVIPESAASGFPTVVTQDQYFAGSPGGLFRHPQIKAAQSGVDLLLMNLSSPSIAACSYFMFSGSDEECWDPVLLARLGYEGFFVITHKFGANRIVPLPELQPYYGVLLWENFERSKYVRKELSRLLRLHNLLDDGLKHLAFDSSQNSSAGQPDTGKGAAQAEMASATQISSKCPRPTRRYMLVNCANPERTWACLNAYHTEKHSSNWLTKQYFEAMVAADCDETINFCMHCVEMYEEGADITSSQPLAGEIGFTIGKVYTSLSGWTQERSAEKHGTTQLVLLGRWLQQRNYAFWSLGHCYCPEMQYKKELGQRIFPREDFLSLLKLHRGEKFLIPPWENEKAESDATCSDGDFFKVLRPGDSINAIDLLSPLWIPRPLDPPAPTDPKGKLPEQSGQPNAKGKSRVKPNDKCPCGSGKKFKKCCKNRSK